ncbi:hypothetical protein RAC89_04480 [Paenibacillus sp. GD4]|nr:MULTISPECIES: hypothetical protein [Paenibacillus]MDQ1909762.1 hypothetical protein [Paenibacillus sp. GD4]
MQKKKPPVLQRRQKDGPNKKLAIWVGSVFAGIIVLMTVLLILNS